MKNIYDFINIKNNNIEDEIKNSIHKVKEDLKELITERMCKIYTSYLYLNLKEKGVLSKIIDTKEDLNLDYSHYFLVIPKDNNYSYIIDLTYSQFKYNSLFEELYLNGFQLLNKIEYKEYLNNIIEAINKQNIKR